MKLAETEAEAVADAVADASVRSKENRTSEQPPSRVQPLEQRLVSKPEKLVFESGQNPFDLQQFLKEVDVSDSEDEKAADANAQSYGSDFEQFSDV